MHDRTNRGRAVASPGLYDSDPPEYVPRIDTQDIFRRLIEDELRQGRLTPSRRRRIVQYATQLGLSATQAGRLIAACRDEVLQSPVPEERRFALRLVEPPPARVPTPLKIALVVAVALVLDMLLICFLR